MDAITSPCILICSIDIKTGYCFGCGRTGAEISAWADYDQATRAQIMIGLEARLDTVERKPRRQTKRQRLRQGQKVQQNSPSSANQSA